MATLHVFRLQPCGAFHFGTQGVGLEATAERCPSDTLYAALLIEAQRWGIKLTKPDADGNVPDQPFRLSSAFPYAGGALLFPRPRLRPDPQAERKPDQAKQLKKLRYISQSLLKHILAGGAVDTLPNVAYQGGAVLIATDDGGGTLPDPIWQETRVDHVAVDRARSASQYYAVGQVRFAEGCGLFILARCNADGRDLLHELLTHLGHSGLGGKRSIGLGQFDVAEPTTIDLPDEQGCKQALLLSRYLPRPDELVQGVLGEEAAYDLAQAGGWLQSDHSEVRSLLRKPVHMLTEGSVVQCLPRGKVLGRVVNVQPDSLPDRKQMPHPVWRYGLALTVGIGGKERS